MFNERFNKRNLFTFDGSSLPYAKLAELVTNGTIAEGEIITVRGMFTHSKSKFGKTGVIVTDNYNIDAPDHLISMIEEVISDASLIEAVNNGKCGFAVRSYKDNKGITRYSGSFVDI